ncbi:Protein CYP-14A3 [Aphelenchoides avenae]|nr:Protein CYP-14A3 [Aphelenchus avenae]
MILLLLAVVVLAYISWYYLDVARYPRGPMPLPLVGNLLQLPAENIHLRLHEMSKTYGAVFTIFTPLPVVILTDYDALKEALIGEKGEHFAGRVHRPPQCFFSNISRGGLFANDGDSWRDQRRVALTILRNFGMGKNQMEQQVMNSVAGMCEYLDQLDDKSRVDMYAPVQLCVGNVINNVVFGYTYPYDNCNKLLGLVQRLAEFLHCFRTPEMFIVEAWPWTRHIVPSVRRVYKKTEEDTALYYDFITKEIEALEKTYDPSSPPTTFVHAYMKEMDDNKEFYHHLTREQMIVLSSDFWAAGMATTATAIRWGIMFMLKWPKIQASFRQACIPQIYSRSFQQRVQAEIDRVVGRDRYPGISDKRGLPYTNAVLLEAQRCANIASVVVPHRCTSDQTVKGLNVPADTTVYPQYYSVLKDDRVFEQPHEFQPERFLKEDGITFRKVDNI